MPRLSRLIVLLVVGALLATSSATALAQSPRPANAPAPAALRDGELRLTYLGNAG